MKNKGRLQKVLLALSIFWLLYNTVRFFLGKTDTISNICLIVFYGVLAWEIIMWLYGEIYEKIILYQAYKSYEEAFKYLTTIHNKRYKLYFSTKGQGNVDAYTAEIERYGNAILTSGKFWISNNLLSKSQTRRVEEILEETYRMMKTVQ
jgi:hypothetical protein